MKNLSTTQIKALRALHDGRSSRSIRQATLDGLLSQRLVQRASHGNNIFELSASGKRWIENYVKTTGDGPEDLKAMFRV